MPVIKSQRLQVGASLIFTLMALMVLSLAAVGLVRMVDTGALVAGNLGFKLDATTTATAGSQQAIDWLQTQALAGGATLNDDQPDSGYFASSKDGLDPTGNASSASNKLQVVNWDGKCQGLPDGNYSSCDVLPHTGTSVNGNKVQWVITRLCDYPGAPGLTNLCTKPVATGSATSADRGSLSSGGRISGLTTTPYYRIITRIEGGRNSVSYIETIVHF